MTDKLYENDGYVSEFEAEITSVKGDWVAFGGTAFYPGGGGQVCDTGSAGGKKVTETKEENNEIYHKIPGHGFSVGDRIWCSVDWDRRYDLMKGHTAEHLLFGSLQRQEPELKIVKIFISPESKYVIVDRDVSWDKIAKAVAFANKTIEENRSVRKSMMDRNDPDISKIRVKLDRIEEQEISVVEIDGVDLSACCGIHVMETGELGAIFVDKKSSAGKEGTEIHFKIGTEAIVSSADLAFSCLSIIDSLGSKPEDVVKTVSNMKQDLEIFRKQNRAAAEESLKSLKPEDINGISVYSAVLPISDRTVLTGFAESCKKKGSVALLIGKGENLAVVTASGNPKIDCRKILSETLSEFNGRGGGKPDFAQGGLSDPSLAEKVLESLKHKI